MEQTQRIPEELRNRLRPHQARVSEILELGLAVFEELLPPPEELVAYSRQELDEEAREALAERLALDEEAVDELLDLAEEVRHELRATDGTSEVDGWDAALDGAYALLSAGDRTGALGRLRRGLGLATVSEVAS